MDERIKETEDCLTDERDTGIRARVQRGKLVCCVSSGGALCCWGLSAKFFLYEDISPRTVPR
jgi:hypothetical protein